MSLVAVEKTWLRISFQSPYGNHLASPWLKLSATISVFRLIMLSSSPQSYPSISQQWTREWARKDLRFVIIKRSFASFCQLVINNAWQRNGELGAVELHFGCFVPGDLRQSSYSTRLRTLCPATRRQLLRQTHPSPARHRWLLVAYLSKVECVKAPSSIHVYAMGRKLFHA